MSWILAFLNLPEEVACLLVHPSGRGMSGDTLKGGKTSSKGNFKRRRDSNRAGFCREHHDNESSHAGTVNAEPVFAEQVLDEDGKCCSSACIPSALA